MRGAPHRGLASAIRWMRARTSGGRAGRPGPFRRLFQVQNSLKPARCQRMTVSGWTMATASAQPCHRRESTTQKRRSHGRRRGRATVRRRMASWWRKARFSSTKAWWVLTPRRRRGRMGMIMAASINQAGRKVNLDAADGVSGRDRVVRHEDLVRADGGPDRLDPGLAIEHGLDLGRLVGAVELLDEQLELG